MPRVKKIESVDDAPELDSTETSEMTVEVDDETGNVTFEVNGKSIEMREPIARDFMTLEAWMRSDSPGDEDLAAQKRDINFMMIKLAAICSVEKITYKSLCDLLVSFEDIERVAAAMSLFQHHLESYFSRVISKASSERAG